MENNSNSMNSHELFKTKTIENVALLEFQEFPLKRIVYIQEKEKIFTYLRQVEEDENIKILLVLNSHHKMVKKSYINFIKFLIENDWDFNEIKTYLEYENNLLINYIRFGRI